jgi:hypothetical protein
MTLAAVPVDLGVSGNGYGRDHRQMHEDGSYWLVFQNLQVDEITPWMTAYITR